MHGGAVSAADVSAVQTSWCKFPDVPWGSGVLSWKGREQTESGIQSCIPETEPAVQIEITWIFPLDLHCSPADRAPNTCGSSVPSPLTWTDDE